MEEPTRVMYVLMPFREALDPPEGAAPRGRRDILHQRKSALAGSGGSAASVLGSRLWAQRSALHLSGGASDDGGLGNRP